MCVSALDFGDFEEVSEKHMMAAQLVELLQIANLLATGVDSRDRDTAVG